MSAETKVSEHLQEIAAEIDHRLAAVAGETIGWSLIVFGLGQPGSTTQYVSNCNRDDVVKAIRVMLDNWEAGMPNIKAHELN